MQFAFRWMNCLLMREISVQNTIRMWDTYLVCHSQYNSCHLFLTIVGGGPRCVFAISSLCVFCLPRSMEREATANGFPGLFPGAHTYPQLMEFPRALSCSCSPYPLRIGATTRWKCSSVKHLYSTQYGITRRAISMENKLRTVACLRTLFDMQYVWVSNACRKRVSGVMIYP